MADRQQQVERPRVPQKPTPVSWSKERGFYWDPNGPYYRRIDVDPMLEAGASALAREQEMVEALKDAATTIYGHCNDGVEPFNSLLNRIASAIAKAEIPHD